MPRFKFKAKKISGEEIQETREAEDAFGLARVLRKEGYILIDSEEEGKKKKLSLPSFFFGGVSLSEKIFFTRNLSVMMGAGLSLARALEVLSRQTRNKKFKKVILAVAESVSKGKNLSESLSEYKKIFSNLYIAMVKSGEKSGKMHESLRIVAGQMEKDFLLIKKVKGAMIYPAIVVVAMLIIGILMLIYVVPTLVATFEELGVELPMSTKIIIWLSKSLVANSFIILGGIVVLGVGIFYGFRLPAVKKINDDILLKLPLFSSILKKINSARTARTLSSLVGSGVDILTSLEITGEVLQNFRYKNVLIEAKASIQKGEPISASFKRAENIFPPIVGEMIAVGEETGKLSDMLLDLANFYEEEVASATKDIASVIEPVLMIIIGVAVGFFAISMIKPMYSMMGGL